MNSKFKQWFDGETYTLKLANAEIVERQLAIERDLLKLQERMETLKRRFEEEMK